VPSALPKLRESLVAVFCVHRKVAIIHEAGQIWPLHHRIGIAVREHTSAVDRCMGMREKSHQQEKHLSSDHERLMLQGNGIIKWFINPRNVNAIREFDDEKCAGR
jgi:hypothetical protein